MDDEVILPRTIVGDQDLVLPVVEPRKRGRPPAAAASSSTSIEGYFWAVVSIVVGKVAIPFASTTSAARYGSECKFAGVAECMWSLADGKLQYFVVDFVVRHALESKRSWDFYGTLLIEDCSLGLSSLYLVSNISCLEHLTANGVGCK